jgi:hypothetical protein
MRNELLERLGIEHPIELVKRLVEESGRGMPETRRTGRP